MTYDQYTEKLNGLASAYQTMLKRSNENAAERIADEIEELIEANPDHAARFLKEIEEEDQRNEASMNADLYAHEHGTLAEALAE